MNTNHTIVDLNKVAYANHSWRTPDGVHESRLKPKSPTVNGTKMLEEDWCPAVICEKTGKEIYPRETAIARAKRRGLLDRWKPSVVLQLSNNHSLSYTGPKAQSIYREFSRRQFKKG